MAYIGSPAAPTIATVSDDTITSAKIDSTSTGMTFADLTVDTNTLVVDETNNRVGIGTNAPGSPLEIQSSNDISMNASGTGHFQIDGNGYNFGIALDTSGANIYTNSGSRDLIFGTNETEQARINVAGLLKFNSGFGSVVGAYGVRAWCKWNMAGTQTILGSGGVSSITDQGTGRTDINFLETMPDINYAATYTIGNNVAEWWTGSFTTTSVRCNVYTGSAYTDQNNNSCIVAR